MTRGKELVKFWKYSLKEQCYRGRHQHRDQTQKPSAGKPEGGIKKTEATIHISNLMLIDPASGKATRTGSKLNDKDKLQRYSKKTGEFIK